MFYVKYFGLGFSLHSMSPLLQRHATGPAPRRWGAMRVERLWSVGSRRVAVRYVGAARVAVLLDEGELVLLLVLPVR